ncbi:tyrosine-type recombinase/integrase [Neoaquamicrobium sediminum]|uniref:tyrosine-type recombinase/integrase n=1 Tax=Neoaquamicrobium sediminum TaxID=1849104 RepID=UPI001FD45E9B|nr:integrase arm-type DNA-binding domain-containing protein [Mesorhizobium sediminum]
MALTDLSLRKAKGREKPYRISDERGLYAIVRPTGAVWWRFDYIVNGKRKTMSMGVYPDVPLSDAREARDQARKLVAKGVDPVAAKREAEKAKVEGIGNTFRVIAQEHIDDLREKGRTPKTIEKNEWYLFDLASEICDDPISEIPASKVLKVIRHIEASGRVDTAHRVRAAIGSVFRLAIRTDRATVDPTLALRGTLLPINATPKRPSSMRPPSGGSCNASMSMMGGRRSVPPCR